MRRNAVLAAMALLSAVVWSDVAAHEPKPGPMPAATVGGPFELVAHDGRLVTDRDFRGRPILVFFGFTRCPDVCPLSMQNLSAALKRLGDRADPVRILFVTVDRAHDTPAVLAEYAGRFHPNVVGLTGSEAQIAAVARGYHVRYRPREGDKELVDHSAYIYLMGPDGAFRHAFHHAASAEEIAAKLKAVLENRRGG